MLWIHYLVSVNHFAKFHKKSAGDYVRNAKKPEIPYSAMVRNMEK